MDSKQPKLKPNQRRKLAKDLDGNILLPVILDELKFQYFEAWQLERGAVERERLWYKCQVLDDVKASILDATQGEGLNYE